MPTYEYKCENCGKFEYEQRITDPHLKHCPTCNAFIKRLISVSGIVFKGSGFHITDYSKDKKTDKISKPKPQQEAKPTAPKEHKPKNISQPKK